MKNLIPVFIILFFCSGCDKNYDPEGIWVGNEDPVKNLLVLGIKDGIAIRFIEYRKWANFKQIGANVFINEITKDSIQYISESEMKISNRAQQKEMIFKRTVLPNADPKAITPTMQPDQVKKFIGTPAEIINEGESEKWLYPNKVLISFDSTGVYHINDNYKKERDFAALQTGMERESIIQLLGNADREGIRQFGGKGFQEWYYGKDTLILDNKGLINFKGPGRKSFSPSQKNAFSLFDVINDTPVGFVIEDNHSEFLDRCSCKITPEGPSIQLSGKTSSVDILINTDRSFSITNQYNYNKIKDQLNTNEVDLKLSSDRFEKGNKLYGFIRLEDECAFDAKGKSAPCYFKGTFECTFK